MFDLGLRKDWIHLTQIAHEEIEGDCIEIRVDKDVVEILKEHGTMRDEIEAIILRYAGAFRFLQWQKRKTKTSGI